jgi:RNA polymerase sigma-70 factor, ECF subfamily
VQNPPAGEIEDDAALVRRIARVRLGGAPEAETELCRRLAPRVRLYGLKHLRDEHAAADLMQQVMMTTIQKLRAGELRDGEKLAPFVFGICRMSVLELRRGGLRRERLLERYGEDLVPAAAAPEPLFDLERVAGCLERLPQRERSVLLMTFYEDKRADEVGTELGLSAGNVRVIRHRGLAHLRECVTGGEQ